MKFFFDTEFTGLHKRTSLISIGIVDNRGEKAFYAELTDYNKSQVDGWISDNVINNLLLEDKAELYSEIITDKTIINDFNMPGTLDEIYLVKGNKRFVRRHLVEWFKKFRANDSGMTVQMISDVCHYDFVLFIDLFGSAFDLPEWISPVCYDLNQHIAEYYKISQKDAFDKSRTDMVKNAYIPTNHNALSDAIVIGYIYHSCYYKQKYLKI